VVSVLSILHQPLGADFGIALNRACQLRPPWAAREARSVLRAAKPSVPMSRRFSRIPARSRLGLGPRPCVFRAGGSPPDGLGALYGSEAEPHFALHRADQKARTPHPSYRPRPRRRGDCEPEWGYVVVFQHGTGRVLG
jgi:hypothetical protein